MSRMVSKRIALRRGSLVASMLAHSWLPEPPPPELSEEDLTEIAPLLLASGAAGIAWRRLRDSGLRDSPAAFEMQQAYRLFSLQAALHERAIGEVVALLRSHAIEPVLVKGWAVAQMYPEAGMRPYGDIDLCVRPDQFALASDILNRPENARHSVDLHRGFDKLDGADFGELYSRSRVTEVGETRIKVPALEDHLRILCVHLMRHGAARPLWLCDVAVMLNSLPDDFDWALCLRGGRAADLTACAIGLAHNLLGARVERTPVAGRARKLPRWVLPSALRQWETPFRVRRPMLSYLDDPVGALKELRHHWPNEIEATVDMNASFNGLPRLPFQLGNCIARAVRLLAEAQGRSRQ
jgi:hypothetical protein